MSTSRAPWLSGPNTTSTLPGLRSRWTIPRACSDSTAESSETTRRTRARRSSSATAPRGASCMPSMNSIAMYGRPSSAVPTSNGRTMRASSTADSARASVSKRRSRSVSRQSWRMSLIATVRASRPVCRARQTSAIAPRPTSDSTSKPGIDGGAGGRSASSPGDRRSKSGPLGWSTGIRSLGRPRSIALLARSHAAGGRRSRTRAWRTIARSNNAAHSGCTHRAAPARSVSTSSCGCEVSSSPKRSSAAAIAIA